MHRRIQHIATTQIPLDLEPSADTSAESALRDAYERLRLARNFSFEEAMSEPVYAIGVRNLAEAIARRTDPEQAARIRILKGHGRKDTH